MPNEPTPVPLGEATNEVAPIPIGEPMWTGEVTLGLCVEVAAGLCRPSEGTVKAIANKLAALIRERDAERWVPTSERLPRLGQLADLWITGEPDTITFYDTTAAPDATQGRTTAWLWDGDRWLATGGLTMFLTSVVEVTHWRPLPLGPALPMEQKGDAL